MFIFCKKSRAADQLRAEALYRIDEVKDQDGLIDDCVVAIDLRELEDRVKKDLSRLYRCDLVSPSATHDALTRFFSGR